MPKRAAGASLASFSKLIDRGVEFDESNDVTRFQSSYCIIECRLDILFGSRLLTSADFA